MTTISDDSKRRRICSDGALRLFDIPDIVLADVASYLALPSRALFAVAMTSRASLSGREGESGRKPSASGNTIASALLAGEQWEVLDFAGFEKSLASRLTDNDIHDVLICIGAGTRLKRLKLAGCVNVTGKGLEPLRGSTVIEQIDVSLVGVHERPDIEPEPRISAADIVPILDSIISLASNSLKHVQLPKKFVGRGRSDVSRIGRVGEFLSDYNRGLPRQSFACVKCQGNSYTPATFPSVNLSTAAYASRYGLQENTCCVCLKGVCGSRSCQVYNEDGYLEQGVEFCRRCERYYCFSCSGARKPCSNCFSHYCKECEELVECSKCTNSDVYCKQCIAYSDDGKQVCCAWCGTGDFGDY